MILSQLHDITHIDSEIVELHEKLQTLYQQRAELSATRASRSGNSLSVIARSINLDDIDMTLQ